MKRNRYEDIESENFYLVDRDGDFVTKVESTGWETVKFHFKFTKDRAKAKAFLGRDLFGRGAQLLQLFIQGFGGSMERLR